MATSSVFSPKVAELGFEPRTDMVVLHSFCCLFGFVFLNLYSLQCCVWPGINGYLPSTLFFKDAECHQRILCYGSYLQNTLFFSYDILI